MPPPLSAVLALKVESARSQMYAPIHIAPPCPVEVLRSNSQLVTITEPSQPVSIAPPPVEAVLAMNVQSITVDLLEYDCAMPAPRVAAFATNVQLSRSVSLAYAVWSAPPVLPLEFSLKMQFIRVGAL